MPLPATVSIVETVKADLFPHNMPVIDPMYLSAMMAGRVFL